ncbi:uncharacterized protein LOC123681774 [Harmonia axyridis]|uniref:uncharacterized protein LOC123681774 n=1 Tax=Harmonia axyridis TaxID=115357 RepID=UPI001E279496|nr:uncharacterized protein LOC123681774 [Harmonia axyridis]
MKIFILFLMVVVYAIQTSEQANITVENGKSKSVKEDKKIKSKENPIDTLLYLANSLLRGDFIATLTKIVEMVQRQDTGLIMKVLLILIHRTLIFLQPIFYLIFPSTKDEGNTAQSFRSRVETMSRLMNVLMN